MFHQDQLVLLVGMSVVQVSELPMRWAGSSHLTVRLYPLLQASS